MKDRVYKYAYAGANPPALKRVGYLNQTYRRLSLPINSSTPHIVHLKSDLPNARSIFNAIGSALTSTWFTGLGTESHRQYYRSVVNFIQWLNELEDIGYSVVKEFETYRVNIRGVKPQSSMAGMIKILIQEGLEYADVDTESKRFLAGIVRVTRLAVPTDKDSYSLSNWLTKHSWIKNLMGDDYFMLESPKRLINSFNVSIASTLIYLLNARRQLINDINVQRAMGNYEYEKSPHPNNQRIAKLISETVTLSKEKNPEDPLSNVIWNDCIISKHQDTVRKNIRELGKDGLSIILKGRSTQYPYRTPRYFQSDPSKPSRIEETLAYWLCVSLAVQPSDAQLLKRNNIAIERNRLGRILFCEITYYKSRADRKYKPPLLKGDSVITKALMYYLDMIPEEREDLFSFDMARNRAFTNPFYLGRKSTANSETSFLLKLWASRHMASEMSKSFARYKSSDLFIKAMLSLTHDQAIDYNSWVSENSGDTSYERYLSETEKPLPQTFFRATHIKNTAVYANSDKYRDEDLVNLNSHTSATEKLSYLTDDNKEWVNQVGRITRMVMDDIQINAYQPRLAAVESDFHDRSLHTRMVRNELPSDMKVNKLGEARPSLSNADNGQHEILVFDCESTAVVMLHYIEQSEKYKKELSHRAPRFFAETVLVNVEWMHYCLSTFTPKNVNDATLRLKRIRNFLPNLFENEVSGGPSL